MTPATAPPSDPAPGPGLIDGLDSLAAALRELRVWAGSPSYARIARDVGVARGRRGVPNNEATPGRVTVYDCFRDGRRRVDTDLVVDIADALGAGREGRALWRLAARRAMRPGDPLASSVAALPTRPTGFTGRATELRQLTATDAPRVQVVHGLPGTGKSALAIAAGHDLLDAGLVDTAIRVGLRSDGGGIDPFDAMVSVLRALDPGMAPPATPATQRAAYLQSLAARRTVLVVDDAASVADVELLLPTDPRTRVIVTSRWMLDWPRGVTQIALHGLDAADCGRLLATVAGRRLPIDESVADELWEVSGGLPLAVMLIGARAEQQPAWTAAEHVHAYRDRLDALQLEDRVLGALTVTYSELTDDAQRALRLVALHPTQEFGLAAAAALTGLAATECEIVLAALERSHLLRRVAEQRWEMHSLVRVFGQREAVQWDLPAQRGAARERLLEYYCACCAAAIVVPNPGAAADLTWLTEEPPRWDATDAVEWLQTERATLLAATDWAFRQDHRTHFLRLSTMLTWHLWSRGDLNSALSLERVAASAAAAAGDPLAEATAERYLGMTYVRSSRAAQARVHLDRAVALLRDDRHGHLPATVNALAICSLITGDYERAVEELGQVISLAVDTDDANLQCLALANLGVAHTRQGELDQAVAALEETARIAVANHWPDRERIALSNLADIFAGSDDPKLLERAVPTAEAAIRLGESFGDEVGVLYGRCNLAIALHRTGEVQRAKQITHDVRERAEQLGAPELHASVLNNLAEMDARDGAVVQARSWFRRAQNLAQEIDAAFEQERAERGLAALPDA